MLQGPKETHNSCSDQQAAKLIKNIGSIEERDKKSDNEEDSDCGPPC